MESADRAWDMSFLNWRIINFGESGFGTFDSKYHRFLHEWPIKLKFENDTYKHILLNDTHVIYQVAKDFARL